MEKSLVLSAIKDRGLVAVVRAESPEQALRITEACLEGGISAVEVTFTVPRASQVIAELARRFTGNQLLLGAGTVLDPETARIAILEGASFVVSPSLNLDTVRLCHRYRVPCLPGCMTIAEVVAALEAGVDIIKVYPGELLGPAFLRSVRGPLPQADMMPTGGVSVENTAEWVAAGAVALGVGSLLTAGAKTGDYDQITRTALRYTDALRASRNT